MGRGGEECVWRMFGDACMLGSILTDCCVAWHCVRRTGRSTVRYDVCIVGMRAASPNILHTRTSHPPYRRQLQMPLPLPSDMAAARMLAHQAFIVVDDAALL